MLGAIIGDLAGSVYEFEQSKNCHPIEVKGDLITKDSFFTDDTILTIAILEAILNKKSDDRFPDYENYLRKYGKRFLGYKPKTNMPHFSRPFSPCFSNWVETYSRHGHSNGNGAMMCISPVAYLFNNLSDARDNAFHATIISHDSYEALTCVDVLVRTIFLARQGYRGTEIAGKMKVDLHYGPFRRPNYKCNQTIDNCLAVALGARSFEGAIRTIISLGGDTDTNACIVGSIAEPLFGIPKELQEQARQKLPTEFIDLLAKGYEKVEKLY